MTLRSVLDGPALPGVMKLRLHLTRLGLSVPAFCEHHRLSRMSIQKLVAGRMRVIDVELVADVRLAGCPVTMRDFLRSKARRDALRSGRHVRKLTANQTSRKPGKRPTRRSARA